MKCLCNISLLSNQTFLIAPPPHLPPTQHGQVWSYKYESLQSEAGTTGGGHCQLRLARNTNKMLHHTHYLLPPAQHFNMTSGSCPAPSHSASSKFCECCSQWSTVKTSWTYWDILQSGLVWYYSLFVRHKPSVGGARWWRHHNGGGNIIQVVETSHSGGDITLVVETSL